MDSYLQLSPDSSTPHTPSPRNSLDIEDMNNNPQFQDNSKSDNPVDFPEHHLDHSRHADQSAFWNQSDPLAVPQRGYLSELYDERMKVESSQQEHGLTRASPHPYHPSPSPHMWQESEQDQYYRRASYPQVRHDDPMNNHPQPFLHAEPGSFLGPYSNRSDAFYGEPMSMPEHMPLAADPSALHGHPMDDPYLSSASASPHSSIHEFDGIDSAHSSPVIVPTQAPFFRPGSSGGLHHHHHPAAFMNPHASLPVMHTDDAASKETQYLRRRCFNCHTTEPPSWRRSTLNPGKIVCNKCGLYERTHLRPRPHRFDELRAGSKARKAAAAAKTAPSPNTSPKNKLEGIKKEPNEGEYHLSHRRGSVTSVGSSGISEWESGSVYSASSSAPNSGYNSPMTNTFPMPNSSLPHSRPSSRDGPIRLPSAPLTDIATRLTKVPPAKASTAPYYVEGRSTTLGRPIAPPADFYTRRASLPSEGPIDPAARLSQPMGMSEVTGWQVVPPTDLNSAKHQEQERKAPRKVAAA